MVNTTTTGSRVLILGDFFLIADRLGMTVELIPHLFGATNRYPTGQRGLYAYWRTGTVVAVAKCIPLPQGAVMAQKKSQKLLRMLRTFSAQVGTKEYRISEGKVLRADHPVVKGREELFEDYPSKGT